MNCRQILDKFFLGSLLSIISAMPVWAQTAPSTFDKLRSVTNFHYGESIEITDEHGDRLRARIAALTAQTLTVTVKGQKRELAESQVLEIRRQKPDSLLNGILIGAGVGFGGGLVATSAVCEDSECAANAGPVLVLAFIGGGIGLGAVVDSSIHSLETVFSRRRPGNTVSMHAAPIVSKQTKGVKVSFRF
jgi:hypothetical protein